MVNVTQIDKIITEINDLGKEEKLLLLYKIDDMFNDIADKEDDVEITLESAFGLWKDRNITKESLRQKAWKQN